MMYPYLFLNHLTLFNADFAAELGDPAVQSEFALRSRARARVMNELMWDEAGGCWRDLWLTEGGWESEDPSKGPGEEGGGVGGVRAWQWTQGTGESTYKHRGEQTAFEQAQFFGFLSNGLS